MFRKNLVCVIIFLFIGVNIVSGINIQLKNKINLIISCGGNTLYVGGTGEGNYTKIQDAIENTSEGDIVFVFDDSSPYYENVVIREAINLIGEDKNTTIIDAGGSGSVVRLAYDYITVSGFTIQNSGDRPEEESGIEISRQSDMSNYCIVTDNIIINNWDGIHSVFSYECVISKNIITNNRNNGIYLRVGCNGYNISYNVIKDNTNNGIEAYEDTNFIFKNIVEYNSNGIVTSNDAYENIIRNNYYGFITSWWAKTYRNIVSDNNVGIFVQYGFYNEIKYNNLLNNNIHVSFEDVYFIFLFPFINPFRLTKWKGNYYEGRSFGPYIISGTLILMTIESELEFEFKWINIDWFPSKKPNNLNCLEEEIKSKIGI